MCKMNVFSHSPSHSTLSELQFTSAVQGQFITSVISDVLKILRNLRRDHIFPADFVDDDVRDRSRVANERAIELLKILGRPGFTGLAESIENNIRDW